MGILKYNKLIKENIKELESLLKKRKRCKNIHKNKGYLSIKKETKYKIKRY